MKNNYFMYVLLIATTSRVFAQENNSFKEDEPIQKILKLEQPTDVKQAILEFCKSYGLSNENTFVAKKRNIDVIGNEHQRHQQYFKGIKVEFGTVITHSYNGQVFSLNGELYNSETLNIIPDKSAESCFQKALEYCPSSKYVWEDSDEAKAMEYVKPKGELVILPLINKGEIKLAYKFDIFSSQPITREEVYVDANTGELLYKNPIIKHATSLVSKSDSDEIAKYVEKIVIGKSVESPTVLVTGSAVTRYSGLQNIETNFNTSLNTYELFDLTRGNGIYTYNSANTNTYPTNSFYDTDNNWSDGNYVTGHLSKDNAALDAHWGAMKTFDFWKNIFGRNSFDDNNGQIKSYVHFNAVNNGSTGWNNASWTGSVMRYGDGSSFNALTSIDVLAHEIGHAVCQYTADLAYQNQSGAMNEGFSDIWGACIEQYAKFGNLNAGTDTASPGTLAVWKIGEQLASSPLRSMSYPLTRGNPDTFKGTNYSTTANDGACTPASGNDWCGVHNNSGVFNHWFYILTAGKSGTNNATALNGGPDTFNVAGIGMAKSSQIAYYVERDYLTANSTFADARNASIAVASTLYCATSPEVQSVTNAWFAVNVGNAFSALVNDVSIKSITGGNINVGCGATYSPSIVIENAGTANLSDATITYNVDGGANSIINWTGNIVNCSQAIQAIPVSGLTRGYHTLNVTITTNSDGNSVNNSKSIVIVVNDNGTVNTLNSFNNPTDVLVSIDSNGKTNDVWERGTIISKTNLTNTVAGSAVYATKLSGNYPDSMTSYLISQCYNLSSYSNVSVSFDMAYDIETNYDSMNFEYSTDSGVTWNVLGTSSDANWYNSSLTFDGTNNGCSTCIGKQWTGQWGSTTIGAVNTASKRSYSHTLSQFGAGGATPASNIIFRFNFKTDSGANNDGVIIDNFVIQGTLSTTENQFEEFAVYPNPSNGKFTLKLSTSDNIKVQLYDMRGRSIYNKTFESNDISFNQELNLGSISSGVYILNVESAGKKEGRRIIIE